MSTDFSRAYELLGVKPGASSAELKAAHRDLAKVWHPDRFLHDPRLQEKAQEKLKEINEAYELLRSGKQPRSAPPPPREYQTYTDVKAPRQRTNWSWVAVALLVFVAGFAITIRTVLQRQSPPALEQREESADVVHDTAKRPDGNTRAEVSNTSQKKGREETENTLPVSATTEPTPALATVTVLIDPESGLLAKSDCPLRSRMTYPSGNQPTAHCNLNHTPPPKDSRIKSIAKSVGRALD